MHVSDKLHQVRHRGLAARGREDQGFKRHFARGGGLTFVEAESVIGVSSCVKCACVFFRGGFRFLFLFFVLKIPLDKNSVLKFHFRGWCLDCV